MPMCTGKNQTNATCVVMHLLMRAIWGHTWKHTVEKSQTNATNATMHPPAQTPLGDTWKRTAAKSQINATNVTMHPLRQAIWGDIWKCTAEKSQTNATCVIMHLLGQTIWGHIWKCTVEKSEQMQPAQFCILKFRQFEDTFEKTQKIGQCDAFLIIYDILLSILIYLSFLLWLTDRLFRPQYSSLVAGGLGVPERN